MSLDSLKVTSSVFVVIAHMTGKLASNFPTGHIENFLTGLSKERPTESNKLVLAQVRGSEYSVDLCLTH